MRVFISLPMKGLSDKEIEEKLAGAKKYILNNFASTENLDKYSICDIYFIDSWNRTGYCADGLSPIHRPIAFLGESISKLSGADLAFFCEGWETARGCKIEHEICLQYGIPIGYIREDFREEKE